MLSMGYSRGSRDYNIQLSNHQLDSLLIYFPHPSFLYSVGMLCDEIQTLEGKEEGWGKLIPRMTDVIMLIIIVINIEATLFITVHHYNPCGIARICGLM